MSIQKTAPDGARVLDLGAGRAARAEARAKAGDPNPFIKLEPGYVEIKPEFDITVGERLSDGKIRDALSALLVDPDDVDFLISDGLSADDLKAIVGFVGTSVGESLASPTP